MTDQVDSNGGDPLDPVIADYLQKVEAGTPPDRGLLLAAHPELADRLRVFFADFDRIGSHGEAFRLPDLALPEDFADYEFLGEIGRGGMGVVYRVRQKSRGRIVALKMILSGPLADAAALRRFREEAETVSRLDHPHVVPIHEVGEHRGLPYFTMRLIEGESLTKCLDRYMSNPRGVAQLLAKVCDAVHHAHQRGVLHRDVKPGNIIIDAAGEPHVTDFGLARRLEEARTLTSTGAILGTPEYMAPEQAAGAKDPTVAVDVYGLGAVLYALLTGRPPFPGPAVYETLRKVVEEVPVPPRKLRPWASPDLEAVCLKCLEKNPARRYASAAALAEDLRRYVLRGSVAARMPGPLSRLYRWARRKPAVAALYAATIAAVILVGVVGVVAGFWQRAEDANRQKDIAIDDANAANVRTTAALKTAEDAQLGTEREREKLSVFEYGRTIQLARQAWRDKNVEAAVKLLDGTQEKHRGWEWHYIRRLCNPEPLFKQPDARLRENRASVYWSSDARRFATLEGVFDATGKQIVALDWKAIGLNPPDLHRGMRDRPNDLIALSPDGTRLLTHVYYIDALSQPDEKGVRKRLFEQLPGMYYVGHLWDTTTGKPLAAFLNVDTLRWSSDGSRVLGIRWWRSAYREHATPNHDPAALRWDARTGAEIPTRYRYSSNRLPAPPPPPPLKAGEVRNPAGLSDGSTHWEQIERGDLDTQHILWNPAGTQIAISSTFKLLGHESGGVKIVDAGSGEQLSWLPCGWGRAHPLAWSPDGVGILTGGAGGMRLWDAKTGAPRPLPTSSGSRLLAFSDDGARMAITGPRARVQVWGIPRGAELPAPPVDVKRLIHSPQGDLALAVGGDVRVLDAKNWNLVSVLRDCRCTSRYDSDLRTSGWPVAWSPDGSKLAVWTGEEIGVWDARTGERLAFLTANYYQTEIFAWNPAGTKLAVTTEENVARVWDFASGKSLLLKGHEDRVWSAAWRPDGKEVVTSSRDKTAVIWDAATGEKIGSMVNVYLSQWNQIVQRPDPTWSPDGRWSATAGVWQALFWDAAARKQSHVHKLPSESYYAEPEWSPDGKKVLLRSTDGDELGVWEAGTWKQVATLGRNHASRPVGLWSPDGKRVLTFDGNDVRVWDAASGAALAHLSVPRGTLRAPRWSPDGKHILTHSTELAASPPHSVYLREGGAHNGVVTRANDAEQIQLWAAESGALLHAFASLHSPTGSADFSADGTRVILTGSDHPVRVFDTRTGAKLAEYAGNGGVVTRAAFSPDGTRIATPDGRDVYVWDAASGVEICALEGHALSMRSVSWTSDGSRVVTTSHDGTLRIWDAATGRQLSRHSWTDGFAHGFNTALPGPVSPDGTHLLATSSSGVEVWDIRPARVELVEPGHVGPLGGMVRVTPPGANNWYEMQIRGLAWSPDGTRIITGSADGTVRAWDPATGRELALLWRHRGVERHADFNKQEMEQVQHTGQITAIVFNRNGDKFIATTSDGTARVFDTRTGRALGALEAPGGAMSGAAFSPDGSLVAVISTDGTAHVWNVPAGGTAPRPPLAVLRNPANSVIVRELTSLSWSPDGSKLLIGSRGSHSRVWDTRTWQVEAAIRIPQLEAKDVSWSPRGDRFLIRTQTPLKELQHDTQGKATLWDAKTYTQIAEISGRISVMAWSADGGRFLTSHKSDNKGGMRIHDAESGKVVEQITFGGDGDGCDYAAFDPSGTRVALGWHDHFRAFIWHIGVKPEDSPYRMLESKSSALCGVVWSPDGSRVATSHKDGSVRVWDQKTSKQVALMKPGHTGKIELATWSPDGRWVLTEVQSEWDSETKQYKPSAQACVWDVRSGQVLREFTRDDVRMWPNGSRVPLRGQPPAGSVEEARMKGLSPDGNRKLEIGPDSTLRILHAATGAELLVLRGEADGLRTMPRLASWSPDGRRIIVIGSAQQWDREGHPFYPTGPNVAIFDATPLGR